MQQLWRSRITKKIGLVFPISHSVYRATGVQSGAPRGGWTMHPHFQTLYYDY